MKKNREVFPPIQNDTLSKMDTWTRLFEPPCNAGSVRRKYLKCGLIAMP